MLYKNSVEYISNYEFEKIDNTKIKVKNASPKKEALGTFLLDFMDTDFDDHIDLYLFVKKYLFIHLLTIYDNAIITDITKFKSTIISLYIFGFEIKHVVTNNNIANIIIGIIKANMYG